MCSSTPTPITVMPFTSQWLKSHHQKQVKMSTQHTKVPPPYFFALASLHLKTCPIIMRLYHLPFYRELSAGSCISIVLQHLIQCLHSLYSEFLRWVKTKIDLIFLYETVLCVSETENLPSSLRWLWTYAPPPKDFSCRSLSLYRQGDQT